MIRYVLLAALALCATPATAQTIANLPVTCNTAGTICTQSTPVTNPDGTNIGGGGGGSSPSATNGGAAPSTVSPVAGSDGTNVRYLRTDSRGGLVPAQGVATSTRTTLAASTATLISAAAPGRIGLTVQIEAALTANLYLCTTQTTACSATSYDALIPNTAGAGTTYTFLFAPSTALYAFTTGTPVVLANSWVAP